MTRFEEYKTGFFKVAFGDIPAYTFSIKVRDLVDIHYVAVRNVDNVEGAVQRVLSTRRIKAISQYILDGNQFFNSFILNWTDTNFAPLIDGPKIILPLVPASTQVIDGQHRIAGYKSAMEEDPSVGENEIIVTLCIKLTTSEAANIFLNINTEQKPVPKSLAYDLFGEVYDDPNHSINRASDLAKELNDDPSSPLYKQIKFPGSARGVGSIELSTFVTALKKHLERDGKFANINLTSFTHQRNTLFNYFDAIREFYSSEKLWNAKSKNPFLKAAGFNGAIEFLCDTLLIKCAEKKSFKVEVMSEILGLDRENLLVWSDLRGLDGKTAKKKVKDYLGENIVSSLPRQDDYAF